MGFYEQISQFYDEIFPLGEEQLSFIKETAGAPGKKILDIACGTGSYAVALASEGYSVTAADIDGRMVELAAEKALKHGTRIETVVRDMREIGSIKKSFDCVFCIGNSIVHLKDPEEILEVLKQIFRLLEDNGAVVLQTINYDRIINRGVTGLPTLQNEKSGLEFVRQYRYDKEQGLIHFDTKLITGRGSRREVYENSVPLYPLMAGSMEKMLVQAGFSDIKLFGGFDRKPYNPDAFLLVAEARKRRNHAL